MSLKKNIVYNTILTVSNVAFPIITTPYVSRVLGVENIGVVNFATTYASYFVLLAALGIPMYGIREIAKHNNDAEGRRKVFSELFVINCLSTLIFSAVYLATIFSIPDLYRDREFLLIAGISVFFVPLNTDWFFSGREKFKLVTLRSLATKIISLGGLFICVRTRDDLVPYMILVIVANLSSQIWNFVYMLKKEVNPSFKNLALKRHLNAVLILFASNVAISLYTMLNTLMLGFMSDYTQVGYYTSAIKISKLILSIVTALSPVMIARINSIKNEPDGREKTVQLLNRSFGMMMMMAVPATIGLIMIAPRFVPVFFGTEFIPATLSLQLLSLLVVIIGMSNFFGIQVLLTLEHEKRFLTAILCGAVTNFCLNLLLIDKYGSTGASIASVIAEIVVTFATFIFALKVIRLYVNSKNIIQPVLASFSIIIVSLCTNCILKNDLLYLLTTIILSGVSYIFIMILIFKNEQVTQIIHSTVEKIKRS